MVNEVHPRGEAQISEAQTSEAPGSVEAPKRRAHSRYRVDLDVTVTSEHNFYAGFVENLSVGGVFIATHQLKPVGARVEFSVNLPDEGEPVRGKGEVRWVRIYSDASNVPPGMGIRFEALDAGSRRRIERFLAQREPMFFDES